METKVAFVTQITVFLSVEVGALTMEAGAGLCGTCCPLVAARGRTTGGRLF